MVRAEAFARIEAEWPAPPSVQAFTTLRAGPGASSAPFDRFNLGARSGDEEAAVRANRSALHAGLGTPFAPRWLQQVHGVQVYHARGEHEPRDEPEADAAITAEPGLPLAILTADCLPVLLCAEDGSQVGAVHAGWRGLAAGVIENAVHAMHAPPRALLAWLGPCAGPDAYEVGEDVHAAFVGPDPEARAAFAPTRPGHWRVDLPMLARARLARLGVQRVFGGGECTISQPGRYFSHRRDRVTGRMASLIWIKPGSNKPA